MTLERCLISRTQRLVGEGRIVNDEPAAGVFERGEHSLDLGEEPLIVLVGEKQDVAHALIDRRRKVGRNPISRALEYAELKRGTLGKGSDLVTVRSVEPSSATTTSSGRTVWSAMERS